MRTPDIAERDALRYADQEGRREAHEDRLSAVVQDILSDPHEAVQALYEHGTCDDLDLLDSVALEAARRPRTRAEARLWERLEAAAREAASAEG